MKKMLVVAAMATLAMTPAVSSAQAVQGAAVGQNTLSAARELYASARYDEALSVLNSIPASGAADRRSVEQYRSLCLLALGRASEAADAIAALVTADPTYRPSEAEASPRVRATFTDVRRRLLPEIIRSRYVDAKKTYDRKEWAAAGERFRGVLSLIDDPDTGGRLSDLRVLVVGFLELSERAATPPEPAPEPVPAARPSVPPAAPRVAGPEPGKVYSIEDEEVIQPVVLKQDIPRVPNNVVAMVRPRGIIEVVIDEQGRPVTVTVRTSLHPTYDNMLLMAAREWKYKPASFNGTPVPFRKLIQIAVQR
jgi:hypothetical protein